MRLEKVQVVEVDPIIRARERMGIRLEAPRRVSKRRDRQVHAGTVIAAVSTGRKLAGPYRHVAPCVCLIITATLVFHIECKCCCIK